MVYLLCIGSDNADGNGDSDGRDHGSDTGYAMLPNIIMLASSRYEAVDGQNIGNVDADDDDRLIVYDHGNTSGMQ